MLNSIRCEHSFKTEGYKCIELISFPAPRDISAWFFGPTRISVPDNNGSVGGQLISSLASRKLEIPTISAEEFFSLSLYKEAATAAEVNQGLRQTHFRIQSQFEYMVELALFSMVYRVFNLIALSVYMKIMKTNCEYVIKVVTSLLVFAMPYIILSSFFNYAGKELLFSDVVLHLAVLVLSALPLKNLTNYLKELRMLSVWRRFHIFDFIMRNIIDSIRNAGAMAIYDRINTLNLFHDKTTDGYTCQFLADNAYVGLCKTPFNDPSIIGMSFDTLPYSLLTNEIGWVGGKMIFDLGLIGLYKQGIVKDIRDPMVPVVNRFIKMGEWFIQSMGKKRLNPANRVLANQGRNRNATVQEGNHNAQTVQMRRNINRPTAVEQINELPADWKQPESLQVEDVPVKKGKVKTRRSANQIINGVASVTSVEHIQSVNVNEASREAIKIGNRAIVPISGSIYQNLWGVLGEALESEKITFYQTALDAGHIGHAGSNIVYDKNEKCYKLRPNLNDRVYGIVLQGEDAIYEALKNIFMLEYAVDAVQKMKVVGSDEINCIVFDKIVGKH